MLGEAFFPKEADGCTMHLQQRTIAAMPRNPAVILLKSVSSKPTKLRVGVTTDKPSTAGEVEGHLEIATSAAGPCQADPQWE